MSAVILSGSRETTRAAAVFFAVSTVGCSAPSSDAPRSSDASAATNGSDAASASTASTADAGGDAGESNATDADANATLDSGWVAEDAGSIVLTSTGFLDEDGGGLLFATSACAPANQSPPFSWSGVPASAQSLALTFVDEDANDATKWVLWNIPPTVTSLPANISDAANPTEVPGASQLGSLGNTGYAGPGVPGPPYHTYQFVLWALDVATLAGTAGLSTAQIRTTLLPAHATSTSTPFVAEGQQGGP